MSSLGNADPIVGCIREEVPLYQRHAFEVVGQNACR